MLQRLTGCATKSLQQFLDQRHSFSLPKTVNIAMTLIVLCRHSGSRLTTGLQMHNNIFYIVEYMEKKLGEFEQMVLLALLRLRENAYGTTIRNEIEKRTEREVSIGALYTTLDRLEEQGLIRSRIGEPTAQRGGRRKKYFTLQSLGEEALAESYRAFKGMISGLEKQLGKL
jgi:DNA-binding PadR family transcriptional regulator